MCFADIIDVLDILGRCATLDDLSMGVEGWELGVEGWGLRVEGWGLNITISATLDFLGGYSYFGGW